MWSIVQKDLGWPGPVDDSELLQLSQALLTKVRQWKRDPCLSEGMRLPCGLLLKVRKWGWPLLITAMGSGGPVPALASCSEVDLV